MTGGVPKHPAATNGPATRPVPHIKQKNKQKDPAGGQRREKKSRKRIEIFPLKPGSCAAQVKKRKEKREQTEDEKTALKQNETKLTSTVRIGAQGCPKKSKKKGGEKKLRWGREMAEGKKKGGQKKKKKGMKRTAENALTL